jgi:hypothetical protein
MAEGSRWLPVFFVATVVGWLAMLSMVGAYCPLTAPPPLENFHIAPIAVCQLKAVVVFWMFLCAMSLAGVLLIKRMGRAARLFYFLAVLIPAMLAAWWIAT